MAPNPDLAPEAGRDERAIVQSRAVVFDAPPQEVWPWLAQMGHGRAGWYSLDVVERMIGAARSMAVMGLLGPGHRIMEAAQLRGLRRRVDG